MGLAKCSTTRRGLRRFTKPSRLRIAENVEEVRHAAVQEPLLPSIVRLARHPELTTELGHRHLASQASSYKRFTSIHLLDSFHGIARLSLSIVPVCGPQKFVDWRPISNMTLEATVLSPPHAISHSDCSRDHAARSAVLERCLWARRTGPWLGFRRERLEFVTIAAAEPRIVCRRTVAA